MKSLENLKVGDLLLVSAKRVKGNKVSLCFAQKIINPESRPASITGLLNKSDKRFTQSENVRYAWMTGEEVDIKDAFGVDCSDIPNFGDAKDLDILNLTYEGQKLSIQITETVEGSEDDVANFETRAKRAGKDGEFILSSDGQYIYMKSTVVLGEAKHVFLAGTQRPGASSGQIDKAIEDAVA